jgi:hypothetical protein
MTRMWNGPDAIRGCEVIAPLLKSANDYPSYMQKYQAKSITRIRIPGKLLSRYSAKSVVSFPDRQTGKHGLPIFY